MNKKCVQNLINSNGRATANQFVIWEDGSISFQSYNSLVCVIDETNATITFGRDWDYSKTTMKHLNTFLSNYAYFDFKGAQTIRKAIKDGYYKFYTIKYDNNMR